MAIHAVACGLHVADGNANNIQVGFIPDVVKLYLMSGSVPVINVWLRMKVAAFTSGGTYEIKAGDTIQGATSLLVRAEVQKVHLSSGTWAAGTAAGYLFWQDMNQTGTFTAENVDLLASGSTITGGGGVQTANVATVAAQSELGNFVLAGNATPASTSYTLVTPANGIQPYSGTTTTSEGFTITATLSTANDVWFWEATRGTLVL